MRLSLSKSKNATSLYVIKDITVKNKRTTKVVEKLGTIKELEEKLNGRDPIEWAKSILKGLTKKEREERREVLVKYSPTNPLKKMYSIYSMEVTYFFSKFIMH